MPTDTSSPLESIVHALAEVLWMRDIVNGSFRYCSPASERIWGCSAPSLMEDQGLWLGAIHPDDRGRVRDAWEACDEAGVFEEEYRVLKSDGTIQWVHDRGERAKTTAGAGAYVAGMARDINRRKQLEAEVNKAYDALHSSVNGVIITDPSGKIAYANPSFLRLFGFPDFSAAVGHSYEQLFASSDILSPGDLEAESAHSERDRHELLMRRNDGSEVLVEVSSSPVHDSQGVVTGSMASFVDVTERRLRERQVLRQHRQLIRMTEHMALIGERERRRASSLIHDTVVQSLALANIRLGAVTKALAGTQLDGVNEPLESARELIAEGVRQARLVMADLTPALLYEIGLGAALRQFADRIRDLQGVEVKFTESQPEGMIPEALRGVLFQAARELVMNACKHAAASSISITLAASEQSVRLTVRDDGCGFDPAVIGDGHQGAGGGFGLFSIRQRLDGYGGELVVHSRAGAGSDIQVALPLSIPLDPANP